MNETTRNGFFKTAALVVGLLIAPSTFAVPPLSTSLPPLTNPDVAPADELSVNVSQQTFLDRSNAPTGHPDSTRLSTRLRTRNQGPVIQGALEIGGSFDPNVDKQTSFEVPEAFLTWSKEQRAEDPAPVENESPEGSVKVHAGRKREAWSDLDSYWTLGMWQPQNRFDGLRPSEQGLTGAFVDLRSEEFELILFATPIFIPEQGPTYDLQDGKFSTNNAWFTPPAERVVLVSKGTPLRYRLETPTVGSVVQHAAGGFLLRYHQAEYTGWRAQAAVMKKPRNQLSLPFAGQLVTDPLTPEASVSIYPQVAYHTVAAAEVSHRSAYANASLSVLGEFADPESIDPNLVWQSFEPLVMISPSVDFRLGESRSYSPWIRLSTLHSIGGNQNLIGGGTGKPEQNPFAPRTMYRQAASIEIRGRMNRVGSLGNWRLEHGLRWIEEFSEGGTVVMTDIRAAYKEHWQIGFYADLLASRQSEDRNPGFISRFRANDRAGLQLTYIF